MANPIPILLCGKIPPIAQATSDIVEPEYKVIKVCATAEDAHRAIAALLSPSTETPTLDGVGYPKPRLIIMGGGYSDEDFKSIHETVDGANSVPWLRPEPGAGPAGGAPPPAAAVAARVRKAIDEHAEDIKGGKGAGQVWFL